MDQEETKEDPVQHEDSPQGPKPRYGQAEVESVCGRLSLSSVSLGKYLVVMRSGFDVVIAGEPYLALMLLLELDSGKFLTRIWNQTITRGCALSLEGFVEACETFFARNGKPCLGLPEDEDEQVMQDFLVSQTPVPRKVSKSCQRVVGRESGDDIPSCKECFKLRDLKSFAPETEFKTEVISEEEEEEEVENAQPKQSKMKKKRQRPRKDVNYFAEVEKKRRKRSHVSYFDDESDREEPYIDVNSYLDTTKPSRKRRGGNKHGGRNEAAAKVGGQAPLTMCEICGIGFVHINSLDVHMKTEHFWGKFKCLRCEFKGGFASELIAHMREEGHEDDPVVKCPRCKDEMPLLDMESHVKGCALEDNVKCSFCPKAFKKGSFGLHAHMRQIHFWGMFRCGECSSKHSFAADLVKHVEEKGHDEDGRVGCPKCKETVPTAELGSHYEECVMSGPKANYSSGMAGSKSTEDKDNALFKTEDSAASEAPEENVSRKRFICPWCGLRLEVRATLENHMKLEHFWGVFKCLEDICDFKADFADDLVEHMQGAVDQHGQDIQCPQCKDRLPMSDVRDHYVDCVSKISLKCNVGACKKEFRKNQFEGFLTHKKKQHYWGEFKCTPVVHQDCNFKTDFAHELISHIKEKVDEQVKDLLVDCPDCSKQIDWTKIESHYRNCVNQGMKCPWCTKKFSGMGGTFNEHRKRVHLWGVFRCPECQYKAHFAKDLVEHMLGEDHTRDQQVFCYQCKSKHPMLEIGPHYEECMKPNQKCPWCAKIFSATSGGLDIHRKTVHFWGNFKCPTCNAKSHFAQELIDHMQAEGHTDDPLINCPQCRNRYPVDEISAHYMTCVSSGWKLKKCLRCKKKFSAEELLAHQESCAESRVKREGSDAEDGKEKRPKVARSKFEKSRLNRDKMLKGIPIVCPVCSQNFTDANSLYKHRRKHFWGKFHCPQCYKRKDYAKDLVEHMQQEGHVSDPLVNCPECDQKQDMNEIAAHYEECLWKKDNKVCETCGVIVKAVSYDGHVKMHLRAKGDGTEDDASLYCFCDRCGKRFTTQNGLTHHIKVVHEGAKVPATCSLCQLTFENHSKMVKHKRKEHWDAGKDRKVQCDECGKCCVNSSALKVHMLMHDDPQYKCGYCEKKLKNKTSLAAHQRQHTGEKPFPCNICAAGFASNSGLGQHMRGVHKIAARGGMTGWNRKEKMGK